MRLSEDAFLGILKDVSVNFSYSYLYCLKKLHFLFSYIFKHKAKDILGLKPN